MLSCQLLGVAFPVLFRHVPKPMVRSADGRGTAAERLILRPENSNSIMDRLDFVTFFARDGRIAFTTHKLYDGCFVQIDRFRAYWIDVLLPIYLS